MIVVLIIICFLSALAFGGSMTSIDQYDNEPLKDVIIMYVLMALGMFGCYLLMFWLIKIY